MITRGFRVCGVIELISRVIKLILRGFRVIELVSRVIELILRGFRVCGVIELVSRGLTD